MRGMRSAPLLLLMLLAILGWQAPARAAAPAGDLVKADLLAEPAAIAPGQTFWVAVRLRMREHWHTYWRNPGDSGEATAITWQLPPGFTAGPIQWPAPHRIPVGPLANYGYDGETTLLTEITAPAGLAPSTQVPINADVTWLVCEKECIPGEAHLSLTMPAVAAGRTSPAGSAETRALFEAARATIPQPSPWTASMEVAQDTLTLRVAASNLKPQAVRSAQFFPLSETLIRHAEPQTLAVGDAGLSLELQRSALTIGTPKDGRGVLVIEEDIGANTVRHAFELGDVAIVAAAPTGSLGTILQAALFALLGGIILNLMPCVFPVLSIKVLSLINHASQSAEQLRRHGVIYTAGVLTTFLVLAGVLLALRAGGAEVGWGFQLQSPITVAVLAYVLFAMGLRLSGDVPLLPFAAGAGRHLWRSGRATPDHSSRARWLWWWPRPAAARSWAPRSASLMQPAGSAFFISWPSARSRPALPVADTLAPQLSNAAASRRLDGYPHRPWPSRSTPRSPGCCGCWASR
jgi:thiol:disulfide interchange protein DsbD